MTPTQKPLVPLTLLPCPFCGAELSPGQFTAFHPTNDCWLGRSGDHGGGYELDLLDYDDWNRRVFLTTLGGRATKTHQAAVEFMRLNPSPWRVPDIVAATGASKKEVYNVLGYLTRKRRIKRTAYGVYESVAGGDARHAR